MIMVTMLNHVLFALIVLDTIHQLNNIRDIQTLPQDVSAAYCA